MLSKISVKKPMTVLVAVVLVLVLGIVSFFKMTPDLLPNMDFPYAVIMTTYAGQTPEAVETTVSKPLEQSMSAIDGVKEITSTSSDNYSLLMIEFEDGTNMDSATVDMRSSLDTIKGNWPDGVGTPYLIKINPNILPVAMTAVDFEGKSQTELSDYVTNELLNELEGIDGVASVSDKGIVTEQENVVLSQDKLDKLNKKISAALNNQFGDAEDKIAKAKKELRDNIGKARDGQGTVSSSIEQINSQQEAVSKQLADAQNKAESGKTQLLSAKMQLLDRKASLTSTKTLLETAYQGLLELKTTYDELTSEQSQLTQKLEQLSKFNEQYQEIVRKMNDALPDSEEYKALQQQIDELNKVLEPYGIKAPDIAKTMQTVQNSINKSAEAIQNVEISLKKLGTSGDAINSALSEMSEKISQINSGIAQLDNAISGLDDKSVSVDSALALISQQQSSADFKMSSALSTLTSKQIETSEKELADKKKEAKSKADVSNTVTLDTISSILTAQNFSMPAGYVTDDDNNKFMVRVGDKVNDEKEMKLLVLFDTGIDGIGVIHLEDVADVFVADNSDETFARINGNPGIVLSFSKSSNTASSTVCENINAKLDSLSKEVDGLHFTNLYNEGDYINLVINNVLQNLLMGAVLAIIILFLFLRDIKPTLIVACSIPISVVFAIVLMYFSGVTLNMISLSGLAIGVGMLVDNSVVVIENIYRLRSMGVSPIKAALNGARQVAGAITASTLTTVCVFLPIVFVEGITRQLFVDLALTVTYSLLASLIVALTLVPAMGQRMLRKMKPNSAPKDGKIKKAYERSLRFVLKHKVPAILVAVALLFTSAGLCLMRGFSFMPDMSSTQIQVSLKLDDNATFEETVKEGEKLNDLLSKYDQFETVGVMAGGSSSLMGLTGGSSSNDAGSLMAYAVLKDDFTKQSGEISKKIEKDLESLDGEAAVSGGTSSSMSSLMGDGSVQITLYGNDLDTLKSTAEDIGKTLEKVKGVASVDNGIGAVSPEIKVTVDKSKAAEKGLTVAQVYQQVAAAISTEKNAATLTNDDGNDMNVVVVKDNSETVTPKNLRDIDITYKDSSGNEKTVKLSSVSDISKSETMDKISRENQKRYLKISAEVKDGYTLTSVSNNVKSAMNDYKLPNSCSIDYAGTDEMTMEAVSQLMLMLLLGIILIYLIMVAQFQSLKSPFIIMFTIPLAFTGGFLALLITGFDISVVSLVGFVMLCGIIVNNGIVLVDYINKLRIDGKERIESIVEAGKTRMRPILITALTTVLGLVVMALGIGTGAEMMQPIAIVCIGGLLYATFMTLYIVPVIYDLFNKKELKKVSDKDLEFIDE